MTRKRSKARTKEILKKALLPGAGMHTKQRELVDFAVEWIEKKQETALMKTNTVNRRQY